MMGFEVAEELAVRWEVGRSLLLQGEAEMKWFLLWAVVVALILWFNYRASLLKGGTTNDGEF